MTTKSQTVYVELLNEGTQVWRPVPAVLVANDLYELLRTDDYDESIEEWKFLPGTIVRCERREESLYAVARASEAESESK